MNETLESFDNYFYDNKLYDMFFTLYLKHKLLDSSFSNIQSTYINQTFSGIRDAKRNNDTVDRKLIFK